MGSAVKGLKSGTIAGAIVGVPAALIAYYLLVAFKREVMAALQRQPGLPVEAEALYSLTLVIGPIGNFLIFLFVGLVSGAVYGRFYERIPGGTGLVKGLLAGVVLGLVLAGPRLLAPFTFTNVISIGVGLALSVAYGALLSYFYGRLATGGK